MANLVESLLAGQDANTLLYLMLFHHVAMSTNNPLIAAVTVPETDSPPIHPILPKASRQPWSERSPRPKAYNIVDMIPVTPTTETHPTPSAPMTTSSGETAPLLQLIPSQTVTRALTTIFTPPAQCKDRYYVIAKPDGYYTEWGIFSDTIDRLYRACQPDPLAYENYYSPGACPSVISTTTTLLIAPAVTSEDFYIPVHQVQARHPPIMAFTSTGIGTVRK
ncbi:hypothetical protein ONZ43_g1177 [Nemania bipapillata]|uniref:Uncharacterized protein n=1 Tax=Nemania bipapillata TaxID=110536 RepID=A0ACC2J5F3_9PEZI|nr:hypothetical protein ONZ43_g1177 [Nemania bipapillata]